jgi:hypothetical protein
LLGGGSEESAVIVPAVVADPVSPRCSTSSTRAHKIPFSIQWWRRSTEDAAEGREMTEIRLGMA